MTWAMGILTHHPSLSPKQNLPLLAAALKGPSSSSAMVSSSVSASLSAQGAERRLHTRAAVAATQQSGRSRRPRARYRLTAHLRADGGRRAFSKRTCN